MFGPVVSPFYSVRVNSNESARVYDVGSMVYISNDSTTTFVFPDRIEK